MATQGHCLKLKYPWSQYTVMVSVDINAATTAAISLVDQLFLFQISTSRLIGDWFKLVS